MRILFSIALGVGAVLTVASSHAQTLFTYGPNAVSKEEFLRVYQKNSAQQKPDFSAQSVNNYINLYSLFRMKVKEAEQMKLDTTAAVRSELSNYKGQLARTYLSDKEVTRELMKQAYERMKEEIKVSHILVAVRPNDDTARAYRKIDSLYQAVVSKKADFAELAKMSDDKGSALKGGDIGYISALQVVYPFENAAYNTPKGQVSKPFRTQFGYHILKVEDRRKSSGQVQVAQIMAASPKSKGEEGLAAARKKIAEIQAALKSGAKFEDLARERSDDKFSKDKGGLMEPFGVGKLMPEFEAAAFALKNPDDISEPVQTEYGIHLIRLVKKIPLQPYDSIQDNIARRVENDSRATVAKEAYQEKVKKQYGFKEYPENLGKIVAALTEGEAAQENKFKAEDFRSYTAPLFDLGGKKYSQYDFISYAAGLTRGNLMGNKTTAINDLYKMYQTTTLNDLQQAELEKNNAEFRNLVTEYRDGILLFELMGENVWNKASKDTAGLQAYYNQHKAKYQWQPGFEGTLYQAQNEADLKQFQSEISKGTDITEALAKINTAENPGRITQQSGRYEYNRFPVDAGYFPEGKAGKIFRSEDGTFAMAMVHKTFGQPEAKSLDEARGFVVADYQDYLEQQWNEQLKAKYPVKVEEKVLKSIIR